MVLAAGTAYAWAAGGCGGASGDARGEDRGSVTLAITGVPDGVSCLEIDVASAAGKVTNLIDATPGQNILTNLTRLPVGLVEVNAAAFPSPCDQIDPTSGPTWESDPVSTTLIADTAVPIDLVLHQDGSLVVTVGWGSQLDPALFDVQDLGALSEQGATIARGINNAGSVVGYSLNGASCCSQAFDTARNPMFIFPATPITNAFAINPAGVVAGALDISAGDGCFEAMTFTTNTGLAPIGVLHGYPCSQGLAIDQREDVVGFAGDGVQQRAFLRSWRGPALIDLKTLGGDSSAFGVIDVTGNQTVVGSSVPADYIPPGDPWRIGHAFVWHEDSGIRDLNDLSFFPGPAPQMPVLLGGVELLKAAAIVTIGHIFGHAAFADGTIHAFHLDPNPGSYDFFDLGTLPGAGVSYALAANDALTAVGGAVTSSGNTAALFLGGTVVDLQGTLGVFDGLHWRLAEATGININCDIVGWGTHDGATRAFKLTPRPGFRCPGMR
jgi:uncharacterized membrane protein